MLPYSPLHHLLAIDAAVPLVMTSGNVSDEPIAYRDDDALERLGAIADLFLTHDRPIHTRTDDTRRPRGGQAGGDPAASAQALPRPSPGPDQAAARGSGARAGVRGRAEEHLLPREGRGRLGRPSHRRPRELRDAALLRRGHRAFPAPVRGRARDRRPRPSPRLPLDEVRAGSGGSASCSASSTIMRTSPPAWPSTARPARRWGRSTTGPASEPTERSGAVSSCSADSASSSAPPTSVLRSCPEAPRRSASRGGWPASWLAEALDGESAIPTALEGVIDPRDWRNCARLVEQRLGSPETTSMGRLFDAVGALCGAAPRVSYEGQAAVELEAMADPGERGSYEIPFGDGVLDPVPAIRALVADLDGGGVARPRRRPLPQRRRRRDRRRLFGSGRGAWHRGRRPLRGACSRTASCWSEPRISSTAWPARPRPRAPSPK